MLLTLFSYYCLFYFSAAISYRCYFFYSSLHCLKKNVCNNLIMHVFRQLKEKYYPQLIIVLYFISIFLPFELCSLIELLYGIRRNGKFKNFNKIYDNTIKTIVDNYYQFVLDAFALFKIQLQNNPILIPTHHS